MREPLDKLLQKLAVNHTLSPYETCPWFFYDEQRGISCSAEVRMGPGGDDIEAEIQFIQDESNENDNAGEDSAGGPQQILWMRAQPAGDGKWSPKALRIKDHDYVNEFHGWEEKGCDFFRSCVESINMGELPDIDTLIETNMQDESSGGGGRGRVGRKSPKVKPGQLMGMKR